MDNKIEEMINKILDTDRYYIIVNNTQEKKLYLTTESDALIYIFCQKEVAENTVADHILTGGELEEIPKSINLISNLLMKWEERGFNGVCIVTNDATYSGLFRNPENNEDFKPMMAELLSNYI